MEEAEDEAECRCEHEKDSEAAQNLSTDEHSVSVIPLAQGDTRANETECDGDVASTFWKIKVQSLKPMVFFHAARRVSTAFFRTWGGRSNCQLTNFSRMRSIWVRWFGLQGVAITLLGVGAACHALSRATASGAIGVAGIRCSRA